MPDQTLCPLCGNSGVTPQFEKNGFTLARCNHCNMVHVSPTPSAEVINAHYQDPTYYEGREDQGYRNYADMEKALRPHFQRRIQSIDQHLPARGRLLDFGCAAGYFLKIARDAGWQIAGVELSTGMAQQAAQLLNIPIESSLDAIENNFDAITLWEVIEHLREPIVDLRQLRDHLRPGGMLMLSTPNTGHWQAVRAPGLWISYRPPSHLLYFTAGTLTDALKRSGFERIQIQRVAPLPPLPRWLNRTTASLQHGLATGQAKPWKLALFTWRVIRVLAWVWQRITHSRDDVFTTLEATAFRPA